MSMTKYINLSQWYDLLMRFEINQLLKLTLKELNSLSTRTSDLINDIMRLFWSMMRNSLLSADVFTFKRAGFCKAIC